MVAFTAKIQPPQSCAAEVVRHTWDRVRAPFSTAATTSRSETTAQWQMIIEQSPEEVAPRVPGPALLR